MDADPTQAVGLRERVDEVLAAITVPSMSADGLRELLIQTERATRQLQAVQADAINEMVARTRLDTDSHEHERPDEFVVDEVAALLSCTHAAAGMRLATAWQASRFPALRARWREGDLDVAKVRVIAEGVAPLAEQPFGGAQLVDETVVQGLVEVAADYGATHTTGQIRQWLNRRVVTVDPAAAERRREQAMTERRVVITPRPDGMSELWALLPSMRARQIQQVLSTVAHDAPADDTRSADQRRADALCNLVAGGVAPPAVVTSLALTGSVDEKGRVQIDPCGELAGAGTLTCAQIIDLLGGNTSKAAPPTIGNRPRLLPCDAVTGVLIVTADAAAGYRPSSELGRQVRERDQTCRFPGCRRAAMGTANGVDVDHTVPWPGGQTDASNLACLCRRHHRLKHLGGWSLEQIGDGVLRWTMPTGRTVTTKPWQYTEPSRAP